jgi:plasmid stabilization system protein ParE
MNRKYTVIWAEVAEADLLGIVEYIAAENLTNAHSVFSKIKEKAISLKSLPERGRVVPELSEQGVNLYRELIINPWRLIYRVSDKKVFVLAVLDSRQNVEDLLLKRLVKM